MYIFQEDNEIDILKYKLLYPYNRAEEIFLYDDYTIVMTTGMLLYKLKTIASTVEPRYLELPYFKLLLILKWKSDPCFNMKLWQQVIK